MATTNSLHHSSYTHHRHNLPSQSHFVPTSLSLKQPTSAATFSLICSASSSSSVAVSAVSTANASATTAETATIFDVLENHLVGQNFRQADEETRRLLIQIAGEAAVKRGYVFFSEVKSISTEDLQAIDDLWMKHSDGRFGYSVQRKIWLKVKKDFTRFFVTVEWMKLLDTEVVQYGYRAFPDEFKWELNDETPLGHLPLTNALRGTQLLKCVLSHPAFATADDDNSGETEQELNRGVAVAKEQQTETPGGVGGDKRVFKTNYTF
ncbi:PREDICTED: tetrapyrrole-binding protein, chloroplastic [Camelina sativa]|uniref:Tetrapyrrole-binding protein, chloroplastic n=1 Tax=Camelina sativa TaxID=90675 RepID=A0ABM0SN82_CAMSA|nr:PREDICTED: tetrapyrrole-binding protein, chloroplastic [Camelina sativa]